MKRKAYQPIVDKTTTPPMSDCLTCESCKHWGGQGVIGVVHDDTSKNRTCMAFLFGDSDNQDFRTMPNWVVTYGCLNGAKGVLKTQKNFGCINHNATFEK